MVALVFGGLCNWWLSKFPHLSSAALKWVSPQAYPSQSGHTAPYPPPAQPHQRWPHAHCATNLNTPPEGGPASWQRAFLHVTLFPPLGNSGPGNDSLSEEHSLGRVSPMTWEKLQGGPVPLLWWHSSTPICRIPYRAFFFVEMRYHFHIWAEASFWAQTDIKLKPRCPSF